MTHSTFAKTNRCASVLNPFYNQKTLYQGPLGKSNTNDVYEEPFRTHSGHLQNFAPTTVGVNQPNDYLSNAPAYTSSIDLDRNDDSIKWACYQNPLPDLRWENYNKIMFKKSRGK